MFYVVRKYLQRSFRDVSSEKDVHAFPAKKILFLEALLQDYYGYMFAKPYWVEGYVHVLIIIHM
jgi:hypothetical protein